MIDLFSGLDAWVLVSLLLALAFVLTFEFINGFHDTANAVATVIYTKAMPPHLAVFFSGVFNFLGVLLGGVGVAYAIVHLLPVELLINVNTGHGLAMVFSLLAAAITWNLGTWYFGIPASSSHTLIGSILGVGLANALINGIPLADGVNWQKAIDIGASLVFSPLAGFIVAGLVLVALKWWRPQSKMHKTPDQRRKLDDKKHPPFWNRLVLVISAMAVQLRTWFERRPERHRPDHAGVDRHRAQPVCTGPDQHDLPDRTYPRCDPASEPVLSTQQQHAGRISGHGQG
ncbi:Phosphate transporter [Pseudomonas amygdali pv. lachrymans]|uniref:Phosphate transporter n=1 Tax=Pseudomonas amygdali pv. lachrymans TaxID=53707 RepID=A0A0P9SUG3_PSEAV|nr:Phosphate transporter [Pseudomonas amygdali pv. lachrymans]